MEITFLPSNYLINAIRKIGSSVESDFLLRAVRVKNTTLDTIKIKRVLFDLRIRGKTVKQIVYPEEILGSLVQNLVKNMANIHDELSQMFLGVEKFWDSDFISSTVTLKPNQETGLLLEQFKIRKKFPVNECVVSVFYLQNGKEENTICRIPVVQYKNKNKYIFPLKGTWLVANNYDNIHVHRQAHSQEFAIDIIQLTNDFKLLPKRKSANKDYPSYGKEIYAVADGEVVNCFNEFPENPPGFGSRLPPKEWDKLKRKYGFVAGLTGNYIILRHSDDEYSFYAHMIPRSLTVKRGNLVKQGQVMGFLGNSGNSDAPHLHFHLMNGPSILSARGLPCRFSNLRDITGEPLLFIEENNSIVHAE